MKKIGLITAACLVSSISLAGAPTQTVMPAATNYFNGFYLGVGAGLSKTYSQNITQDVLITDELGNSFNWHLKNTETDSSAMGKVFAGYGHAFNQKVYLGAEVFGRYNPSTLKYTVHETDIQQDAALDLEHIVNTRYSYGALIRGGFLTSEQTLLYVLAGYTRTHAYFEDNIQAKIFQFGFHNHAIKHNLNLNGITAGLGMETYLTNSLSVRAQYAYTWYKPFKYTQTSYFRNQAGALFTLKNSHKETLQQGVFSVDLAYHIS